VQPGSCRPTGPLPLTAFLNEFSNDLQQPGPCRPRPRQRNGSITSMISPRAKSQTKAERPRTIKRINASSQTLRSGGHQVAELFNLLQQPFTMRREFRDDSDR